MHEQRPFSSVNLTAAVAKLVSDKSQFKRPREDIRKPFRTTIKNVDF